MITAYDWVKPVHNKNIFKRLRRVFKEHGINKKFVLELKFVRKISFNIENLNDKDFNLILYKFGQSFMASSIIS